MSDARETIALLHRRAGWGLAPGQLDAAVAAGVDATIAQLVDPDASGVPPAADPWAGLDLSFTDDRTQLRTEGLQAVEAWLDHLVSTPRALEDWMVWFWHGHFVSGLDKVKVPALMVEQLRTFRRLAFARFPDLVKAATTDAAMLLYLDGATSTGQQPNENYGRELLELFTLGIGNYGEADVQAGARALTGWTAGRRATGSRFVPRRHDDSPQSYLGREGVHDLDTVVEAVTSHPACAPFIAGKLANAILGDVDDATVTRLAATFAASGLDVRTLVRAVLQELANGNVTTIVDQPVPWMVAAQRATGATVRPRVRLTTLRAAGQVPMFPPNVAGWPRGTTWFGASTVVARFDFANQLVGSVAASNPALQAAQQGDAAALAGALGRPGGFCDATTAALRDARGDGRAALALALASPDLGVA